MDTSDPLIEFDDNGICNHCRKYDEYVSRMPSPHQKKHILETLVTNIKASGTGKDYDCIIGLSGGVDSSYMVWYAVKKFGLRPLVVHIDTGWNSELAVNNIQNIVQKLKLDMHTLVIDWEEIRDLQRSYFFSGIANLDVPQDHAFIASLNTEAKRFGIKNILNGSNMQTESFLPSAWEYDASDSRNLLAIHQKFGRMKLTKYPIYSLVSKIVYYPLINRIRIHRPLNLLNYNKSEAKNILASELGWRDYGGKHYESMFTRFHQAHYLPVKFGYDKRKAHLSSLIASGQISRNQAESELDKPLYDLHQLEQDRKFFIKKLGLSLSEYEDVMAAPPAFYSDFKNNKGLYDLVSRNKKYFTYMYGQ
jgi:N-acetyl sugar amidotransferase